MKKILAFLFCLLPSIASAQIVGTLPFQLQNGTTADASQVMADFNKILADTNANAAHSGVNADITSLTALIVPITPTQGGSTVYFAATSGGTANAQTIPTPSPIGFTKTTGRRITFLAGFTNTGAATLNVNSTGVTALLKPSPAGPIALTGGEVIIGNYIEAVFDGTQYVLYTNAATSWLGASTVLALAATTDLGTITTHNIRVTSSASVTSFGSTADINYPLFKVWCNCSGTLVYNATSMILPGAANIPLADGDTFTAAYLGSGNWKVFDYNRASGTSIISPTPISGAQGLVVTNNSGTPNTNIDVTADQAVLINPSGAVPLYAQSISLTINTTTTGVNGLDTGGRAASTFYNIFLISDGNTIAGLASLSATAPTMPATYVYRVRLGAMLTDGSGNFLRTRQVGNKTTNLITVANLPSIATGNSGVTSRTITTFVPPTAVSIFIAYFGQTNGTGPSYLAAAGYSFGALPNTQPFAEMEDGTNQNNVNYHVKTQEIILLSTAIFTAATGMTTAQFSAAGWRDKVNAN